MARIDIAEARDARRAGIGATDTMASANGIIPWHKRERAGLLNASGDRSRVLEGSAFTAAQFLQHAGLDWTVSRRGIFLADQTPIPSHEAIVRDSDGMQLGVVSAKYVPVQNVDAFAVMDAFVAGGFGTWETAGSLWDGKTVYVSIRVNDAFEVLDGDRVESYLVLSNSHDGGGAVRATRTDVRIECNNTLRASRREGRAVFSLRHTTNVSRSLAQAKEDYLSICERAKITRDLYRKMAATRISSDDLREFISDCLQPMRKSNAQADSDSVFEMLGGQEAIEARAKTVAEKRREETIDRIMALADSGQGTSIPGVKGSLWGAYNAVTEYASHYYPVRNGGDLQASVLAGAAGELLDTAMVMAQARVAVR